MFRSGGQSAAWLCVLLGVFALVAHINAGGSAEKRRETSSQLTNSSAGGDNLLVSALVNISSQLSGVEAVEWNLIIEQCNASSYNASFSSDEVIVLCGSLVEAFFQEYPDVAKEFLYVSIGGWGNFNDLFQEIVYINAPLTESVIVLVNGQSELELAIEQLIASISDKNEIAELEILLAEIHGVLNDTSLSYDQQMAKLSAIFTNFFSMYPDLESVVSKLEIPGFGPISSFLDVANKYYQIANFGMLFNVAAGQSNSYLVSQLLNDVNSPAYNFTRSEKTLLLDFINDVNSTASDSSLSVDQKIAAIVAEYKQFMLIAPFLQYDLGSFEIAGFGTFQDLLNAYDFYQLFGAQSTPAPTTHAPSTTPMQGNCASASQVVALFNGNQSIFYQSTNNYLNANPGIQATNFRPYLARCQTIITNTTLSSSQVIQQVSYTIKTYCGTNTARQSYLYSIQLGSWGTIGELLVCGGY